MDKTPVRDLEMDKPQLKLVCLLVASLIDQIIHKSPVISFNSTFNGLWWKLQWELRSRNNEPLQNVENLAEILLELIAKPPLYFVPGSIGFLKPQNKKIL